ncbi:MAG: VWA domain-containing protein [Treponema sp.]|nr:VWA domain-containing protein [Treponema sp.]
MERSLLRVLLFVYTLLLPVILHSQDLSLSPDDLRIDMLSDGGYNLFIRYKTDISSVLLTETTRDPKLREDNYAYRTAERNAVNGDEIRLIDGRPIPRESNIYSLVSSTPKTHPDLGWAYQIYIPETIYYGYEGGRNGEVRVGDGTYLNIRAFYYAYADYRGPFRDNPFMFHFAPEPPPPIVEIYMQETVDSFTEIAGRNALFASGSADLSKFIEDIAKKTAADTEIVICLDTTGSMKPHVEALRLQLVNALRKVFSASDSFKIGMVLYRDYNEAYLNKVIPFTKDLNVLQRSLNGIRTGGGGDIPEAVYEALHTAAAKFPWTARTRNIILIGDAPPHPLPRGKVTKQMAENEAANRGIKISAIILPQIKK